MFILCLEHHLLNCGVVAHAVVTTEKV